jgi:transposase
LARQVLNAGDTFRVIGDQLADFVRDADFADLYPAEGKPALSPALLALVSVFQAMENLSDRQAAAMVRTRLDWKYALHLPLAYRGFDYSVLSEFRARLLAHEAQARVFEALLGRLAARGLVKGRGIQRTDAIAVCGAVRRLSRLELVYETLRVALTALRRVAPRWVSQAVPDSYIERYGARTEEARLVRERGPKGLAEGRRLAAEAGRDGQWLLQRLAQADTPKEVPALAEVQTLRQVWAQQFEPPEPPAGVPEATPPPPLPLPLRAKMAQPASALINSPHDPQARFARKRDAAWLGYKAQVTETVTRGAPRVITDIRVTPATDQDTPHVAPIQAALRARGLAPRRQVVDGNYVAGHTLTESAARHIQLLGPARPDTSPQARRAEGFGLRQFTLDPARQRATCPGGQAAGQWLTTPHHGRPSAQVRFDAATCARCPLYARCVADPRRPSHGRTLTVSADYAALEQRRREQRTPAFRRAYARRAGIEASLSLLVRAHGLRRARYRGARKTGLQLFGIGAACDLKRCARWLAGDRPIARGRRPKGLPLRRRRRPATAAGPTEG